MPEFPGTTGRQYLFAEIKAFLVAAGCPTPWEDTLAAIAWYESGGWSNSLNDNPATHDFSVGWFQINYFGALLAPRTAEFGTPESLAGSPIDQAHAAVSILGGGPGITAWTGDTIGQQAVNVGGPLTWDQIVATFEATNVPPQWYADSAPPPAPDPGHPTEPPSSNVPNPPPTGPPIQEGDTVRRYSTEVKIESGYGWSVLPEGVDVTQVVTAFLVELDPEQVQAFTAVPAFYGLTSDDRLVFGPTAGKSIPNGDYGVVVWANDSAPAQPAAETPGTLPPGHLA